MYRWPYTHQVVEKSGEKRKMGRWGRGPWEGIGLMLRVRRENRNAGNTNRPARHVRQSIEVVYSPSLTHTRPKESPRNQWFKVRRFWAIAS